MAADGEIFAASPGDTPRSDGLGSLLSSTPDLEIVGAPSSWGGASSRVSADLPARSIVKRKRVLDRAFEQQLDAIHSAGATPGFSPGLAAFSPGATPGLGASSPGLGATPGLDDDGTALDAVKEWKGRAGRRLVV